MELDPSLFISVLRWISLISKRIHSNIKKMFFFQTLKCKYTYLSQFSTDITSMLPWFKVWWHGQKMSLSRYTTSGTKIIILDYESKYFCLYDNVNNSSQYSIFDFDLSLGTVLNQLNLPVLFCYVTYCIVVVFPSLFHSLQYYTNTTVPRFFRRRLLLLQKCSPRVNINDDTKPTNLFMVVVGLVEEGCNQKI